MDQHRLAQELRERQYFTGLVPREWVDALPDDEIIDCYITCSDCGEKQVSGQTLALAISRARNAEHFLDLCEQLASAQYRRAHRPPKLEAQAAPPTASARKPANVVPFRPRGTRRARTMSSRPPSAPDGAR